MTQKLRTYNGQRLVVVALQIASERGFVVEYIDEHSGQICWRYNPHNGKNLDTLAVFIETWNKPKKTEKFEIILPCVAVEDIDSDLNKKHATDYIYNRLINSIQDRIANGQLRELAVLRIALDSGASIVCQIDSAKMADSQN